VKPNPDEIMTKHHDTMQNPSTDTQGTPMQNNEHA